LRNNVAQLPLRLQQPVEAFLNLALFFLCLLLGLLSDHQLVTQLLLITSLLVLADLKQFFEQAPSSLAQVLLHSGMEVKKLDRHLFFLAGLFQFSFALQLALPLALMLGVAISYTSFCLIVTASTRLYWFWWQKTHAKLYALLRASLEAHQ
jgi:hypothetical protein